MIFHQIMKQLKKPMGFQDKSIFSKETMDLIIKELSEKLDFIYSEENSKISEKEKKQFASGTMKSELIHGKYIIQERHKRRQRIKEMRKNKQFKR